MRSVRLNFLKVSYYGRGCHFFMQKYCFFHIHSESSYDTCGPRRDIADVAQLFLVQYERDYSEEKLETNKQATNMFQAWHQTEIDPVSTLVAKYNGSTEISEIIKWISETINDGDARKIPPFKSKTPQLSAEEVDNAWSKGSQKIVSSGKGMKQCTSSFVLEYMITLLILELGHLCYWVH
ncbi:uncharacterized protein [Primulina eburnea]|uniref:uncharacterized protein n=1 Tax=Primulina eburnea TaxID=1245227 RepID=UPI003C6C3B5D